MGIVLRGPVDSVMEEDGGCDDPMTSVGSQGADDIE